MLHVANNSDEMWNSGLFGCKRCVSIGDTVSEQSARVHSVISVSLCCEPKTEEVFAKSQPSPALISHPATVPKALNGRQRQRQPIPSQWCRARHSDMHIILSAAPDYLRTSQHAGPLLFISTHVTRAPATKIVAP